LASGPGSRDFDFVELYPPAGIDDLSALTAACLLVNVIGAIVRQV
jgi:agmatinase